MTLKEKFASIDQSKLKSEQVDFLKKIKTATKDFTVEDTAVNEKIDSALEKMIASFKKSNPEAIKVKEEEKKEPSKEEEQEKAKLEAEEKEAAIKKNQLKEAKQKEAELKRLELKEAKQKEAEQKEAEKQKTEEKKAEKKANSEMEKLLQFVRRRKELKNIAGTDILKDAKRQALPSGKRVSKEGNVYYESRENRIDRTQGSKTGWYLENGGAFGAGSFEGGGFMPNNYEGRDYGDIWDKLWSDEQKYHFLSDHKNEIGLEEEFYNHTPKTTKRIQSSKGSEIGFSFKDVAKIVATRKSELPRYVKLALEQHIREGQYENGGAFGAGSFEEGGSLRTMSYVEPEYKKGRHELAEKHGIFPAAMIVESDEDSDDNAYVGRVSYIAKSPQDEMGIKGISREYAVVADEEEDALEEIKNMFFKEMSQSPFNRKTYEVTDITFKNKKMAMGGFTQTDLAGHLGGAYDFGKPTFLDGYTGTHYTGLVGETGAMSSGEMFENGGAFGAGSFSKGGFIPSVEFQVGDLVWDRGNKRYGTVMNVFDNPINGEFGDIRLDSDGMQSIFTYDKKNYKNTGYNLIKLGEKGDQGSLSFEDLKEIKDSANRLIDSQIKSKDKEKEKYYRDIYRRLLDGEFDSKAKPNRPKKYVDHDDIESVTLNIKGKEVTVKGSDVLNGANLFEEGGQLGKIANYIPKRDVVSVKLKNGETVMPANGYWIKKNADLSTPKRASVKDSDIKVGAKFKMPDEEIIEIKRTFNEPRGRDTEWVEYLRNGKSQENSIKELRLFLNNWKAVPFTEEKETQSSKSKITVSKLSEIPNLNESLKARTVTYRGLGLGKLSRDFYDLTGTGGVRIKVSGKEYFITDEDFDSISRDSDGKLIIRFDAPNRKYESGGTFGAGHFMTGGNIDGIMQDASQSYVNYYLGEGAAQGIYAKGGMLSANERYVLEIAGLTRLRKEAIEKYVSENSLTESEVLNIVIGLGRRQLKGADVTTAIVGTKNNDYSKELIAFAKSDKALRVEFGGSLGAYN